MSGNEFNKEDIAEIDHLADRVRKVGRRDILKAGRALAFVIPALAMVTVPRLGMTGSGGKASKK